MQVWELIETLQEYPSDSKVIICTNNVEDDNVYHMYYDDIEDIYDGTVPDIVYIEVGEGE